MRRFAVVTAAVLPVLALASTAFADAPAAAAVTATEPTPVGVSNNSLSLLLGYQMPGLSELALEYTRVVTPHFEISGQVGKGAVFNTTSGSVIPRLRAQVGAVTFAVGAGFGVFRETDDLLAGGTRSNVYSDLIADAVISYETEYHLLLQVRGGAYIYNDHDEMNTTRDTVPFGAVGVGFRF